MSDVVLDSGGRAYPAINDARQGATGVFPCVWTITPHSDLRRVAVGLAEVDVAQKAVVDADSRVAVVGLPEDVRAGTWGSLATRSTIATKASARGLDFTGISDATRIGAAITTLSGRVRSGRSLDHLEAEMQRNFGVR